jgi:hypothetical protein
MLLVISVLMMMMRKTGRDEKLIADINSLTRKERASTCCRAPVSGERLAEIGVFASD